MSKQKKCPIFKECYGSCFGSMIRHCLSEGGKSYEECQIYQEYLLKKVKKNGKKT